MIIKNRPTHGLPQTEAERAIKRGAEVGQKDWAGGPRFVWTSTHGSHHSNTGTKRKKGSNKPKTPPERRVIVPGWARKYQQTSV